MAGIFQADMIWRGLFLGLRYTLLNLTQEGSSTSISANSLGFGIGCFHVFGSFARPR